MTDEPAPYVIVGDDEAADAMYGPDGPSPRTPLGAATLWREALVDRDTYRDVLDRLSYRLGDWPDLIETEAVVGGLSIASGVQFASYDTRVAYVKLLPPVEHTVQVFADHALGDVHILTLVRCPDGWWRVWGLSHNYWPDGERVRAAVPHLARTRHPARRRRRRRR